MLDNIYDDPGLKIRAGQKSRADEYRRDRGFLRGTIFSASTIVMAEAKPCSCQKFLESSIKTAIAVGISNVGANY